MTPGQVFTIAVIGGLATAVGLVLVVALALGIHALVTRIVDWHDAYRERRAHAREQRRAHLGIFTSTQHAIDALPTTRHPTDN